MRIRKAKRGFSLLEVLVATGMLLMVMLAVYASLEFLVSSNIKTDAKLEPLSEIRRMRNKVFGPIYGADEVFHAGSLAVIDASETINGRVFTFPNVGSGTPGNILLVAVPEDSTRPLNPNESPFTPGVELDPSGSPDGYPDGTYTVVMVTTEPLESSKTSRANPNAEKLVVSRWFAVSPDVPRAPATIDLTALAAPNVRYEYAVQEVPGDFEVTYNLDSAGATITGAKVSLHTLFSNENGAAGTYDDNYDFTVLVRNRVGL